MTSIAGPAAHDSAPPVGSGLLEIVLVGVVAICILLAVAVVAAKIVLARSADKRRRRLAPLRADLLAVAAGESDPGACDRLVADTSAGAHLDRAIIELLTKVRGTPADDLVDILRRRDAVDRAVRDLGSRSSVHRARAARLLGLLRDPAHTDALVRMLDDRSPEVRLVAARAIGGLGPQAGPDAGTAVLKAVRDRGDAPGVPATVAVGTLDALGMAAEPAVDAGLADADAGVRNVAAAVAGHSLFLAAAPRLAELATTDPDRAVRVSATTALGHLGRAEHVATIAQLLAAHEPSVLRRAAALALGELSTTDAAQVLLGALIDADRALAVTAAEALSRSSIGRDELTAWAADDDRPEAARSAATGVLQVLRLREAGANA